jgi:hypothetical protein
LHYEHEAYQIKPGEPAKIMLHLHHFIILTKILNKNKPNDNKKT